MQVWYFYIEKLIWTFEHSDPFKCYPELLLRRHHE